MLYVKQQWICCNEYVAKKPKTITWNIEYSEETQKTLIFIHVHTSIPDLYFPDKQKLPKTLASQWK